MILLSHLVFVVLLQKIVSIDSSHELVCDYGENCDSFCSKDVCEYRWIINHRHAMSWRTFDYGTKKTQDYPLQWNSVTERLEIARIGMKSPENPPVDQFFRIKDPMTELENIMPVDGRGGRRVITINNQFSGPVIKVRKGAIVKVVVNNNLPIEAITIHWHGLFQTDNYWMDGAAFVNQCPIMSTHNFTYVWRAEQTGTYWYHSHNAIQRLDGLFGGILIYEREDTPSMVHNEIPLVLSVRGTNGRY